jgi:hypothetical protein
VTEQEKDSVEQQKDVAYYTALVNAWIQTKMERDKRLVWLSAGGIGLLVTILSAVGVKHRWEILLYCGALTFFAATATLCIYIFDRNSKHIAGVLKKKTSRDYVLKRLDKLSLIFFVLAVLFSIAIGLVTAFNKLNQANAKGNLQMCDEKRTDNTTQEGPLEEKSLDGIGELNPIEPEEAPNESEGEPSGGGVDSDKQSD